MFGILIQYQYTGDEAVWRSAVDAFISAVDANSELGGRFSYAVSTGKDATSRIHVGRWSDEETLKLVQSRDYFKNFAPRVQEFAGDTLATTGFQTVAQTGRI